MASLFNYQMVDSAVYYGELALKGFEEINHKQGIFESKGLLIEQLYIKGELFKSLKYAFDVEELARNNDEFNITARHYNSIGNNLKRQEDYSGAIKYYHRSALLAKKLNDSEGFAFTRMNLAECHLELGNMDSAWVNVRRGLRLIKESRTDHIAFSYTQIGKTHLDENNIDSALFYLRKGVVLSKQPEMANLRLLPKQLNLLAVGFVSADENDSAIYYASKALKLARQIPVVLDEAEAYRTLYQCFEKLNNIDSAYLYLKQLDSISAFIQAKAGYNDIKNLAQDLERLKGEALIQEKNQTLTLIGGVTFLVLILAIAMVARVRYMRHANKKLEKARMRAERSEAMKKQFLANMSHEIRTPMNAILGMVDLVLDSDLKDEQRNYLEIVKKSSRNLLIIINDILDLSKLEAGKMEVELMPYSIVDEVNTVHNTLKFIA
ncbi:MAG: tetratricopeptide repeat protein, partial [Bacteroidetes bacterium]|nr:tetratricopeptide repeat protein [Bacteroidota bacterium]